MGRVRGKVAIVTGGAKGIGAACVRRLAEEGARVAVVDMEDEPGRALASDMRSSGLDARYFHCDVSSESQVAAMVTDVVEAFGEPTVLVNNAGIAGPSKPTHELTEEEWDRVQAVNVKGVFLCTKHVIGPMRRAGGGSIINLSSIYGLVGAPDVPPYHASKGAVRLMSKTDALLYAGDGIRVNSVHPGFIWTPMVEHHLASLGGDAEQARRDTAALHPLGRMGDVDDIAWGIVFLASDESAFMTGSELVIDGGYTCR
jgi:NAD(P)-dependent dehydrogenase (short-subunit alcohol dehydrogenase family)